MIFTPAENSRDGKGKTRRFNGKVGLGIKTFPQRVSGQRGLMVPR